MESTLTTRNVVKDLSTGQSIYLTVYEDRMLKRVYDYLAGYAARQQFVKKIELKKEEVSVISSEVKQMISKEANHSDDNIVKSYRVEQRNTNEIQTDAMFKAKDELQLLEEKFKHFENQHHKIGFKDIDLLLRKLGVTMPKKNIEVSVFTLHSTLSLLQLYYTLSIV
jgi:hypothetical protein